MGEHGREKNMTRRLAPTCYSRFYCSLVVNVWREDSLSSVYVYAYVCADVHMWRPEDSLQCCSRGAIHLVFRGALSLTWSSPSRLACRPLGSTSSSGITSAQHLHGLKGSNSGPHVCKTSILLTELLKGELMETKTNHKRDWEAYNTPGILRNLEMNRKS